MKHQALLGPTKARIMNYLLEGRRTAGELADSLDMQVSAARKHLEMLTKLHLVSEEFVQSGVGRPKKFYSLSIEGRELFPREYDRILNAVIEKLVQAKDRGYAESILKQVAIDLADQINLGGETGRKHTELLIAALNQLGFEAEFEETRGALTIVSHNCPVHKTALRHHDIVCHGLHDELLKTALGRRDVRLEKCFMSGDAYCRHVIPK